jgi:hypothetical protein
LKALIKRTVLLETLAGIALGIWITYALATPIYYASVADVMDVQEVDYRNGRIHLTRSVSKDVTAEWTVVIVGTECHGQGTGFYGTSEPPSQVMDLEDFVGDPDPEDCDLPPGEYFMIAHWDIDGRAYNDEFFAQTIRIRE